ncbi:MAG TPA: PD-(D/E)XK nuclease family protein [Roseimicrobium sp.]|nr:PD-(D/E)XK nuclease family protein [Roseimicrobium sp.]
MHVRFLLGPAGSGKTHRCLAEIGDELRRAPEGSPLLLLAPKQATFQLERQLLSQVGIDGFTRLQILSFERLANLILMEGTAPEPRLLDEEGRLMVLRALLLQRRDSLKVFHATARLPGFARELGGTLQELQRHQVGPETLRGLVTRFAGQPRLSNKLHDLAVLLEEYQGWLKRHELQDSHRRLDLAVDAVKTWDRAANEPLRNIGGLWLDGFAELTTQERALLSAILPFCKQTTLAFCLENEPKTESPWLSLWSVVAQTYRQCRLTVESLPGISSETDVLNRDSGFHRLKDTRILGRIERDWSTGVINDTTPVEPELISKELRVAECANPEAEATVAAREILRHVRDKGGRYRDCAVLVRSLDGYHDALRRVFRRHQIPFFLDRRQSIAHHPLAELVRSALRLPAYDWRTEDWFGALKTGLVPAREEEIDRLENDALAYGWEGDVWMKPITLAKSPDIAERAEALRLRLIPPFVDFIAQLQDDATPSRHQPSGKQLAAALRELWRRLDVETRLDEWSTELEGESDLPPAVHRTVWDQLNQWANNVERAFGDERLSLRQWLPILESGLGSLSVGVIPPSLDQVLIGSVDRSRNPDLRLALVLGMNETVFPAVPSSSLLLNDNDRAALEAEGIQLSLNLRQRLAHERYLGYIACSRSRERLVLTFAASNNRSRPLNPSPFLTHIHRLVPGLVVEKHETETDWIRSEHVHELLPRWIAWKQNPETAPSNVVESLQSLPGLDIGTAASLRFHIGQTDEQIAPETAAKLYGPKLASSISRLEEFAACPFRFFTTSGLKANERQLFELDSRERGNFQHELLARFHQSIVDENRKWRDLTPSESQQRLAAIAEQLLPEFRDGLLIQDPRSGFLARNTVITLQSFIGVVIEWMHGQYRFDPTAVELDFGDRENRLPPWEIDLGEGHTLVLRGKIDRIDIAVDQPGKRVLAVIIDYKSSAKQIDTTLLQAGIQLQLPAYLAALLAISKDGLGTGLALEPAGFFYVNLQGGGAAKPSSRSEIVGRTATEQRKTYQHLGRFDFSHLSLLDSRGEKSGDQFKYTINKDGTLRARSTDPLPTNAFQDLLKQTEVTLRSLAQRIYSGETGVNPARTKKYLACEYCPHQPVCRIDPWTHPYRMLKNEAAVEEEVE